MIEFTCSCGKSYSVKDEMAGKTGKCKACGAPLQVPRKIDATKATRKAEPARSMPWDSGSRRKLAGLEKKCGESRILLISASRRFFSGPGNVEFRADALRLQGPLGPDPVDLAPYWLVTVIGGVFLLAAIPAFLPRFIPAGNLFVVCAPIFLLGCVIYLMRRLLTKEQAKTINIMREKIAAVKCNGPIVHIKFTAAPVPGVGAVRMFITSSFRTQFFQEFNKLFPEYLPDEYRAALKQLSKTGATPES